MESKSVVRYNELILDVLLKNNRQISCPLFGKLDYKKKVQTFSIEDNDDVRKWETIFCDFSDNELKNIIESQLFFISTGKLYNRILGLLPRRNISEDANLLVGNMKKINFGIIFGVIRVIYQKIKGCNMSTFANKIKEVIEENFEDFGQINKKYGKDVVFYLLNLLVNSIDGMRILVNEKYDGRNVYEVYSERILYTRDGMRNLYQQMLGTLDECDVPFGLGELSEYEIDVSLVIDLRAKRTLFGYSVDLLPLFFHSSTVKFLNERKHNKILNGVGTYIRTFRIFLESRIKPEDRQRYLLAGSVIKSIYNIRDCSDVDFLVMDHENNIEKYGTYKPQMGCGTVYNDFGKTYYGNEKYYFPMIPEMYNAQQEYKKNRIISDEKITILNNFPPYSVSGLKAGRYVDIFVGLSKKLGYKIDNLDDLLSDPACRIYLYGCPVINLKLEMVRDNVKDIDLGRISRKQYYDMDYLEKNYGYLFDANDKEVLGFSRLRNNSMSSLVKLDLNCYHCENDEFKGIGYDLVIRRYPLYLEDMMRIMIRNGPLLISVDNDVDEYDINRIYQRPLLSSLKDRMEYMGNMRDVEYYYEVSSGGAIIIYIGDDISFYRDICVSGRIRVVNDGSTKKIGINVNGKKMRNIYQQIMGNEKKKEYRMMLINLMKNFIQLHKMIDSHTTERIMVEILK